MPDRGRDVGTHAFRENLDDHELRIAALEAGGGGGGITALASYNLTDSFFVEEGDLAVLPSLQFDQQGTDVLVHVHFEARADVADFTFGATGVGLWTIKDPGEELDREPITAIALGKEVTLPKEGVGTSIVLEALLPAEGFAGTLEPDEQGKITWDIAPMVVNPPASGVNITVNTDLASPVTGFGHGGSDTGFAYAVELG